VKQDLEAIRDCLAGKPESFEALVVRYQREAIGHALAILGRRDDALDAVQEAFLDAFRGLNSFDTSRPFYSWFYVILRNRCYKLLNNRRQEPTASLDECDAAAMSGPPETTGELLQLQEALARLSPQDREIVVLRHLDGLSYRELAERLAIPLGTVMSRLYKARRRLRNELSGSESSTRQDRRTL